MSEWRYSGLRRTTDATVEPLTYSDVHDLLQTSGSETFISGLITTARMVAEQFMRRALITQTWTMSLDSWPSYGNDWWESFHSTQRDAHAGYIELPYPPLSSVTSVTTYDDAGTGTAITLADYFTQDTNSEPGRLALRSGASWPTDDRTVNQVVIVYVAGYGAAGSSVPRAIRHGMLMHINWMYEHRGDEDVDMQDGLRRSGAASVYSPWRIERV